MKPDIRKDALDFISIRFDNLIRQTIRTAGRWPLGSRFIVLDWRAPVIRRQGNYSRLPSSQASATDAAGKSKHLSQFLS